ncbi:response regulator [Candidatus Venteria ishoeyi]|uniref:response regulator n=1 Tax=Candidatus Venteria ishoeyi TaxID=1899563 RepID=UPI0025A56CC0|nr:response regulator [Candidatus Venteria ishoeyi]MDM8547579.1 response regulator [Candidatus Venteria ishoeyi]
MNDKYCVLVVDDEAAQRKEIKALLEDYDFEVETAANGEEGLEKLLTDRFDVAVVDLKMPKMNGLEMIRRADAANIDTYAVILTGMGGKEEAVQALRLQRSVKDWVDKSSLNDTDFAALIKKLAIGVPLEEVNQILSKLPPVEA